MRALLLSALFALVAFFATPGVYAQGTGHCLTHPLVPLASPAHSQPLAAADKTPAKDSSWMASRIVAQAGIDRASPTRSHAPVMCLDPRQPGCQVEMPEAPQRHGSMHMAFDAARAVEGFEGLPPPPEGAPCAGGSYDGGPREGYARPSWRPPAA